MNSLSSVLSCSVVVAALRKLLASPRIDASPAGAEVSSDLASERI